MLDNLSLPPRPAWAAPLPCIRCKAEITEPGKYVYCSDECRETDVPTEPGKGGAPRPHPALAETEGER